MKGTENSAKAQIVTNLSFVGNIWSLLYSLHFFKQLFKNVRTFLSFQALQVQIISQIYSVSHSFLTPV